MATDPAHQRRGAARCLLEKLTELADDAGKDTYLVSTDAGRSVYAKAGFTAVKEIVLDLTEMGEKEGKERFTVSTAVVLSFWKTDEV
jgi:GNAT superfamily N-acetyltransferase